MRVPVHKINFDKILVVQIILLQTTRLNIETENPVVNYDQQHLNYLGERKKRIFSTYIRA